MAAATTASSRALVSASSRLFWSSSAAASRSRVECCAASSSTSNSAAIGSSLRWTAPASAPPRIVLPPQMIPIPAVIEVDQDDEEELTFLEYDDDEGEFARSSPWLSSQYLSLRIRCSSLMMQEANDALSRHFKGREPTVSVSSMLKSNTATAAATSGNVSGKPGEKKATGKLKRINESCYRGDVVKFIKDVVLSDEQEGLFD